MNRSAFSIALLFFTSAPALSQTVLDTPEAHIEVIGLKRWTLQMLQDSIAVRAPEASLASYACAAVLRSELGFADASVNLYPAGLGGRDRDYVVITLVEPQDSARIRYRPELADTMPDRLEWREAIEILREHNQDFQIALYRYAYLHDLTDVDTTERVVEGVRVVTGEGLRLRTFLQKHRSKEDFDVALEVLAQDGNYVNRTIAAVILGNFHDQDSVWWALADALRDPDARVNDTAGRVLEVLSRQFARTVNWAPMADTLRYLLDGTNLFAHNTIMQVLAATEVAPALAPALLKGGGELILAKVRSADPSGKQAAIRLLTQLSGREFGEDAEAWEAWTRRL